MSKINWLQEKMFSSKKHCQIFLLLCLSTLFNFMLVGYRIYYTGFDFDQINNVQDIAHTRSATFMFLIWNLFLAWIPYWISMTLHHLPKRWMAVPVLGAWLVFLPNAPYLVTDLFHVGHHPPVPFWYDTLLLFSFAWTGLLLGFLSLLDVQRFLEKKVGKNIAALLTWAAILLCAFGVYLGRFQRWNTWDLITHPSQLFWDIMAVVMHPVTHIGSLGLAVVMAGVLGVGYLTMKVLISEQ